MTKKLFITGVIILYLIFGAYPTQLGSANPYTTLVVTPGADPTAVLLGYGKFRNFTTENSWEAFLGLDSATGSSNDVSWDAQNTFAFTYSSALDKLNIAITNTHGVYSFDYLNYSTQVLNLKGALAYSYLSALNYLQMRIVVENHASTVVNLTGVMLDGNPLGDFSGTPGSSLDWNVTGYDLSAGFTLTGTLAFSGINSKSPEQNKVDLFMGRVDHEGPVSTNLVASPNPAGVNALMSFSATIDDTTTGLSMIASADYRIGQAGSWSPMAAQDGSYDESAETVEANFSAPDQHGMYDLCVKGTDTATNEGSTTCISLSVDDQGPITTDVLLQPSRVGTTQLMTVTATISDTFSGGSVINSAEYSLDSGQNWDAMQAEDGTFDEVVENVKVTIFAPDQSGTYNLCVRGYDSIPKQGSASCKPLIVDGEGPGTVNLDLDPNPVVVTQLVTVTATISDTYSGGSVINSAEYSLDSGQTWDAMQAEDGAFDEVTELVIAAFDAPGSEDTYTLCVRGWDALGNTGAETCAELTVKAPEPIYNKLYLPLVSKSTP
ncbi:MAG: hypothetical protein JSV61_16440 [Anaerolineales bacterium]|nr:MAG: hypothetical protein JSV61_16440 [Anaerolineales bacterium]